MEVVIHKVDTYCDASWKRCDFFILSQMYTTYSMVTNLLVNIAIGIIILLILSVVVITIMFWFDSPSDQITMVTLPHHDHHTADPGVVGTSLEVNLPLVLKILISCEGAAYIVVNMKMLQKWVSGGSSERAVTVVGYCKF